MERNNDTSPGILPVYSLPTPGMSKRFKEIHIKEDSHTTWS